MTKFFLFFILLTFGVFADESPIDFAEEGHLVLTGHQFVSLGGTCHTAIALRGNNLRKSAFPFDWSISLDHEGFIRVLEEDFFFYTDENSFARYEDSPAIENLHYSIYFPHDFDLENLKNDKNRVQWNTFKAKYDRRVARFRSLRDYPDQVFFIRAMWSSASEGEDGQFNENTKRALELKNALDRYFPYLDFRLIILSYDDLPIPPMDDIEGVIEFRIGRSHQNFLDRAYTLY